MSATRQSPLRETAIAFPPDLYDVAVKYADTMQAAMLPLTNTILDAIALHAQRSE